eukprot:gene1999-3007_t
MPDKAEDAVGGGYPAGVSILDDESITCPQGSVLFVVSCPKERVFWREPRDQEEVDRIRQLTSDRDRAQAQTTRDP